MSEGPPESEALAKALEEARALQMRAELAGAATATQGEAGAATATEGPNEEPPTSDLEVAGRYSWRHGWNAMGLRRLLLEPPVVYFSPELCPDCNCQMVGNFDCNPFTFVCWRCGHFWDMKTEVIALGL